VLSAAALATALLASGAWSSVRPPECSDDGGRMRNVWERAKAPDLRRYCDAVASASAKLAGTASMAQAALDAAREAERTLPGHAAPLILEGRALAALGQPEAALAALREGKGRDPRALDEPRIALVWARTLARNGQREEALVAYRGLLPRASSLSLADRAAASLESGIVALTQGAGALDEAVAALRSAVRSGEEQVGAVALLALALAMDRHGESAEARALIVERSHGDPRTILDSGAARESLAVAPEETHAMAALALEPSDAAGARDAWHEYADAVPTSPWAAHARAHLAALAPGGGKQRVR
jgi:tetratricopeptide (TPR) repeat protein